MAEIRTSREWGWQIGVVLLLTALLFPYPSQAVNEGDLEAALDAVILPFYTDRLEFGAFKGESGLPVRYARLVVPDERGALIISSGRTESYIKYAELIYDLRETGFSIYILDHRGQGFSGRMLDDTHKGHVKDFNDYTADFKTFIDTVVDDRDHKKRFILDHSMGGTITTLYAARHPGRIDGIIMSSPMMLIDTGKLPYTVAKILVGVLTTIGRGNAYIPGGGSYDPEKPFENNKLTHSNARFAMNKKLIALHPSIALGGPTNRWLKEAFRASRQAIEEAVEIDVPILLLQSRMDKVVKLVGQDRFCAKAANCKKVRLEGAKHEILMETDQIRDQALTLIKSFLDNHAPAP